MPLRRAARRCWSALIAVVLLCAQLSVAAHTCMRAGAGAALELPAAAMAAMPDCAGMGAEALDSDDPQRCKAHCEAPGWQPLGAALPDLAAQPLLALPGWPLPAPAVPAPARHAPAFDGPPPAGAPPLYLSLLVLRN